MRVSAYSTSPVSRTGMPYSGRPVLARTSASAWR